LGSHPSAAFFGVVATEHHLVSHRDVICPRPNLRERERENGREGSRRNIWTFESACTTRIEGSGFRVESLVCGGWRVEG
jgi:hypothetical protein